MEILKSQNLLIVEDDKEIRENLSKTLENYFHVIYRAANGRDALEILQNSHIDIVITDYIMPKMNGAELAEHIRDFDVTIPIVMISSYSEKDMLMRCIPLNLLGYLSKPLSYKVIKDFLHDVLAPFVSKKQEFIQYTKKAMVGDMLEAITHQWKQPLTSLSIIFLGLQEHREMGLVESDIGEMAEHGIEVVNFMTKTIDDFKNFYSPNKKKSEFSIYEALSEVERIVKTRFHQSSVSLTINVPEELLLYGVKNEFKQMLLVLFNNAIDAILNYRIQKGLKSLNHLGTIMADAQLLESGRVALMISDNGGGVEEKNLNKIFSKNFTTKEDSEGSGIGLNIAKMIIEESFLGTIKVENAEMGAKFTITV